MLAPSELYIGSILGTKVLMRLNALPAYAALLIGAFVLSRVRHRHASLIAQLGWAGLWFAVLQAAYLLHTIGHILSARYADAPMDAVLLARGLQGNLYLNSNVTPAQHIGRAAGGPLISAAGTISGGWLLRPVGRSPLIGAIAETWFVANLLVLSISLLPLRALDGYSLLRWTRELLKAER